MKKQTIKEMAEKAGFSPGLVYNRMSKGWTLERALKEPKQKRSNRLVQKTPDQANELIAVGVANGIPERIVRKRLANGWSIERATETPFYPRKKQRKFTAKAPVVATESDKSDGIVASAAIIAAVVVVLVFLYTQGI